MADPAVEPVAEGSAADAAAPAEAAPAEPSAIETAEAAKPEEAPAEAAPPEEAAPEPRTYEAFTLPDGLTAPEERVAEFTSVLGKYNLSQEAGQELMDLHAAALQQATSAMDQHQRDVFDQTRANWRTDFDRTAGNRRDTILTEAKSAIELAIPDAEARKDFWRVMAFTGVGDHPAMINAWAAVGRRLSERAAPPPGLPPKTTPTDPATRRYGAQNGAGRR